MYACILNLLNLVAEAARIIIGELKLEKEVAFGRTKLFVKEPRTLGILEEAREAAVPKLVTLIQVWV